MKIRKLPCLLLGVVLTCNELCANWTLTSPSGGTQFEDDELVTGSGMAPDPNTGATFYFEQKVDGDYVVRGSANVQSFTDEAGMERWSQTLDPDEEQPDTHLWPTSPLNQMQLPTPDYETRIHGDNSTSLSDNHTVVAH